MAIHDQHHTQDSKQTMLLAGYTYVGVAYNGSDHEAMKDTANVKVHLSNDSGNGNAKTTNGM